MQASDSPDKISIAFAASGGKQAIPTTSQIGIEDGRASYPDGFPPLTRTPLVAGGVPPFGTDMNGILYAVTNLLRWQNAGGTYTYDAALATEIGGYPAGALLFKADGTGYWRCLQDNNTSDPDTGGAGWEDLMPIASAAEAQALSSLSKLLTPGRLDDAFKGGNQSLSTPGIQRLPGELILQWGQVDSTTTYPFQIVFPVSFPNACFSLTVTGWVRSIGHANRSQTGATLQYNSNLSTGSSGADWFAIGY